MGVAAGEHTVVAGNLLDFAESQPDGCRRPGRLDVLHRVVVGLDVEKEGRLRRLGTGLGLLPFLLFVGEAGEPRDLPRESSYSLRMAASWALTSGCVKFSSGASSSGVTPSRASRCAGLRGCWRLP